MKEDEAIARVFGLKKDKHKKILLNDNEEVLENDIKRYDKIHFYKKQDHVIKFDEVAQKGDGAAQNDDENQKAEDSP